MHGTAAPRWRALEALLWTLLAAAVGGYMLRGRPDPLSNDSYQYLNIAENLRAGRGAVTTLVYWDAERAHGRIPAPATHFPPGYPAAVAIAAGPAGGVERAARWLSWISFSLTAGLLAFGLNAAGAGIRLRAALVLLLVVNVPTLTFATSALAEAPFTFLITAAVVLLLEFERRGRTPGWIAAVAFVLAGVACWLRYAGLFVVTGLCVYAALRAIAGRDRRLAAMPLIAVAIAGALLYRNAAITGSLTGGHDKFMPHPVAGVLAGFVRAQVHLLLGVHDVTAGIPELLLLGGVAALLIGLRGTRPEWPPSLTLLAAVAAIYSAAMIGLGWGTFTEFSSRLFVPLLPVCLLTAGALLRAARVSRIGLALVVAGYAGANARDFDERWIPPEHEMVAVQLAAPGPGGAPLASWIAANVRADEPIFTQLGQAAGYLLHRPTVALSEPYFSTTRWDCSTLRAEMQRFAARRLLLFGPTPYVHRSALLLDNSLVAGLLGSGQPPCGFTLAAENAKARVLELGAN